MKATDFSGLAMKSIGTLVREYGKTHGALPAIIYVEKDGTETVTSWEQLNSASDLAAAYQAQTLPGTGNRVACELKNCPEHLIWAVGTWKAGNCFIPMSPSYSEEERAAVLGMIAPSLLISDCGEKDGPFPVHTVTPTEYQHVSLEKALPIPDHMLSPSKGMLSGGTTSNPKLVMMSMPMCSCRQVMEFSALTNGCTFGQTQLVAGPLYHSAVGDSAARGLMADHRLILMERFSAEQAAKLIEKYGVQYACLVPTMLSRIAKLPDLDPNALSSLEAVFHTGGYCTTELKKKWIDMIGGEHIYEMYCMTEFIGMTTIRGDEWLEHPGSVGRGRNCDIEIRDEAGQPLPPGEIGIIYMRNHMRTVEPLSDTASDGFETVGDMGILDKDGYLYFADRRSDMIVTGGKNVYACEVESALLTHPDVLDVAVLGVEDEEWGRKVCAYVILSESADSEALIGEGLLRAYLKQRISHYKVPKEIRAISALPRNEAGKLLRKQLRW